MCVSYILYVSDMFLKISGNRPEKSSFVPNVINVQQGNFKFGHDYFQDIYNLIPLAIAPLIKKRVGGCRHGTGYCQVNN